MTLQKPGAGIPFFERFFAKYFYIGPYSRKWSWEFTNDLFQKEGRRVLDAIDSLNETELTTPVLIERLRGLEDSSRFWSVAMTAEHLLIVGNLIVDAIEDLAAGRVPGEKADIAKVKPKAAYGAAEIGPAFRAFLQDAATRLERPLTSRLTHPHPWFGPMTAVQWHTLLALHQRLHRGQINRILAGLRQS